MFNQVAINKLLSSTSILLVLLTLLDKVNSLFLYLKTHVLSLSNIYTPKLYHTEIRWFLWDSWVEVVLLLWYINVGLWCSNGLNWSKNQFHLANFFQGAPPITFLWCSHFAHFLLKWRKWWVFIVAAHCMISHTYCCHPKKDWCVIFIIVVFMTCHVTSNVILHPL